MTWLTRPWYESLRDAGLGPRADRFARFAENWSADIGLLAMRIGVALVAILYGAWALFGTAYGGGIERVSSLLREGGFYVPEYLTTIAGVIAIAGGAAVLLGELASVSSLLLAGLALSMSLSMVVTRVESLLPALWCTLGLAALGLALTGPGRLTLSYVLNPLMSRFHNDSTAHNITGGAATT